MRCSLKDLIANADALAVKFENYDPKHEERDAPLGDLRRSSSLYGGVTWPRRSLLKRSASHVSSRFPDARSAKRSGPARKRHVSATPMSHAP